MGSDVLAAVFMGALLLDDLSGRDCRQTSTACNRLDGPRQLFPHGRIGNLCLQLLGGCFTSALSLLFAPLLLFLKFLDLPIEPLHFLA